MKFGPVALDEAEGCILAHSAMAAGVKVRKGRVLSAEDIALFRAQGVTALVVAALEAGDMGEDAAATRLARAVAAAGLECTTAHTGRVNLKAVGPGIVRLDAGAVGQLNRVDPAITLATLAPFARVGAGTLVGTVKIISYAVAGARLETAASLALGAVSVWPVVMKSAGLVLTAGEADKLTQKGREVMGRRLRALGMSLAEVRVVAHEEAAIAQALAGVAGEIVLLLTGAATSDLYDTGPQALRAAGGEVARFGMPVDPGNLLFFGRLGRRWVIGLPGCARSPALNGADWVLERLVCGLEVTGEDVTAMGVGGLLKEIAVRGQPRDG